MSSPPEALVEINLEGKLEKLASGKVRDVFVVDDKTLLFVASDRISAYDVIMKNGIPEKGALLTAMSAYWFNYIKTHLSNLQTHFLSTSLPSTLSLPPSLTSRSMHVRRLQIYPLESIVRGYITGSAWSEYKLHGTVHGIPQPANLIEGQKLPKPLWTPSTKAPAGEKDENISPAQARAIVGEEVGQEIERISLAVYEIAARRAEEVGIVLADTKFEFGFDAAAPTSSDGKPQVVLVDEVLTPDSSRFWPMDTWEENLGGQQPSFDKQFLRDWLTQNGLKRKEGVVVPDDVVERTREKYREAFERITGEKWKGS